MTEIRPNLPLYQLDLSTIPQGDYATIYAWRQNIFNYWDDEYAHRCTPLHIKSIHFMWYQKNNDSPDEVPEFNYADSISSFNYRANNNLFPDEPLSITSHTLNDIRLKHATDTNIKTKQDQIINIVRIQIMKNNALIDLNDKELESVIVKKLMAEVAGSETIAQKFLDSFTNKISTLDDFFANECQTKIRETLEKVFTIMQSVTPSIYHSFVMKGGEFINFNELYNRCCQDKGTSSLVQNIIFLRDIAKSRNHTARSKAIAMEEEASKLFGNYIDNPIKIGEVFAEHEYEDVECYTPYMAYKTLATLMIPLSMKETENIMANLATKIGKALNEVNLRDMLEYKNFLHNQIDLATGADRDFNEED